MIKKIKNYEDRLIKKIKNYEVFLNKIISFYDNCLLKIIDFLKSASYKLLDLISKFGKFMRYSTYPLHWIWIKIHLAMFNQEDKLEDLPIFKLGAHYIYGKPKSGKSTLVYHAMMEYAFHTGKTSYTTANMETPRKNIYGKEYYYHQLFDPSEFYEDGEQIVQFNHYRHNVIVYEEVLAQGMHQRNNNKKSYNDVVLPMLSAMGTQRHQSIDLFYFISQLPRGDISLMHMLAGHHEPKIKKVFDYKYWLKTGKFKFKIKGWYVTSHDVIPVSGSDYKLINKKKWFYKCKYYEEFDYFNMLNMQDYYKKLPMHKGVEMQ